MSLPLLVRRMDPAERPMVLSNWKHDLAETRRETKWGVGLREGDFWCLVDHVLDKVTLPSCDVYVGCHENEPDTPCCWVAIRGGVILATYARQSIRSIPELAAGVERDLLSRIPAVDRQPINPFKELRR